MPRVKLRLFATLRRRYGVKEIEVDCDGTLEDLVEKVSEKLGKDLRSEVLKEDGSVRDDRIILVNGKHAWSLGEEERKLKEGDVVSVFPPLAGGYVMSDTS